MTIVFVSNFLNQHQHHLCLFLQQLVNEFYFIELEATNSIGYQIQTHADFVLQYYKAGERDKAIALINQADVVIFGGTSPLMYPRIKENKITYLYIERYFKKGIWRRFVPTIRNAIHKAIIQYKSQNLFVLCASAYTSYDLSLLGFPSTKCFKWGYFPLTKHYCINDLMKKKETQNTIEILWAGRFIKWKHPEHAILIANELRKIGYNFHLSMIGDGCELNSIRKLATSLHIENYVDFLGGLSSDAVREHMEKSHIFLFTSDYNEGWGAVLNEAMNSACAVIVSHAAGSVPYLINNGNNGLIYQSGNWKEAFLHLVYLIDHSKEIFKLGTNAYLTIVKMWNAKNAAKCFVNLVKGALQGHILPQMSNDGVCSSANVIKNNWYKAIK